MNLQLKLRLKRNVKHRTQFYTHFSKKKKKLNYGTIERCFHEAFVNDILYFGLCVCVGGGGGVCLFDFFYYDNYTVVVLHYLFTAHAFYLYLTSILIKNCKLSLNLHL